MNANIRGLMRKLESKRGTAGRILLAWVWGKSDAEVERTIADLSCGSGRHRASGDVAARGGRAPAGRAGGSHHMGNWL
jgi:hypothetical protein